MPDARRPIRIRRVLLASLAGFALLWHVLPILVWTLHLGPELEGLPNAHRLRVPTHTEFRAPDAGWVRHAFGGVELYAPGPAAEEAACGADSDTCMRATGAGMLSISSRPPGETLAEMEDLRAPDVRDLALSRSSSANWSTIRALRDRVTTSRASLDSWRFTTTGSMGIVAESERAGRTRFVIVAFPLGSPGAEHARRIGIANVERSDVMRIVGSIRL